MTILRAALAALGTAASLHAVAGPVRYDAKELAAPAGAEVHPAALNAAGQVAGWIFTGPTAVQSSFATGPDGGALADPCPPGQTCYAHAIDDAGRVAMTVSYADAQGDQHVRSIVADIDGAHLLRLDNLNPGDPVGDTVVLGMSASGKLAGYSENAQYRYQAFLGKASSRRLRPLAAGWDASEGDRVNDAGEVVGTVSSFTEAHAFVTRPGGRGTIVLPGLSVATAIANDGLVAGFTFLDNGDTHAMLTRAHAAAPRDLGTLGGALSQATGVNDAGTVVGYATTGAGPQAHAFVYDVATHRMSDLNDLVTLPPGVFLQAANAVNARGQIVAFGSDLRGYLLTPR